jgi:hypothetical protein
MEEKKLCFGEPLSESPGFFLAYHHQVIELLLSEGYQ